MVGELKIDLAEYPGVVDLYSGQYRIDLGSILGEVLGQSGQLISNGYLYSETHPDLRLRPTPGKRSKYWEIRTHPMICGLLRKAVSTFSGTDYRIESAPIPAWLESDPRAEGVRAKHTQYIERWFSEWSSMGRSGIAGYIRSVVQTSIIQGFSFYEIVATPRSLFLAGSLTEVYWPEPLHWRAPWSVRYLVTDREKLLGVVCDFSYSRDYSSKPGYKSSGSQVVIPAEKLLWVTTGAIGDNDHCGRSWLRDIYNYIIAHRKLTQVESLAVEINGLGELVITMPQGGVSEESQGRLEDYLLNRTSANGGGLIVPDGCKVERLPSHVPELSSLQNRLERNIALAWLQDERLIALQNIGSLSARDSASADSREAYDSYLREMIAEPLQELFYRMIALSFPQDIKEGLAFVPKLGWGQIEERSQVEYTSTLSQAVSSGLIQWREEDEEELRKLLDLMPLDSPDKDPRLKEVSMDEKQETLSAQDLTLKAFDERASYMERLLDTYPTVQEVVFHYGLEYTSAKDLETAKEIARAHLIEGGEDPELELDEVAQETYDQLSALSDDLLYISEQKSIEELEEAEVA